MSVTFFPQGHMDRCKAQGITDIEVIIDRYEMNLSDGNADVLLRLLGLWTKNLAGEVTAEKMLNRLSKLSVKYLLKFNSSWDIDKEQAEYYLSQLRKVAEEAKAQNVMVQWY